MLKASTSKKTRGFTLVELSIVLVIIGLIIGGVLTGLQVLQNAQITNTINAMQAYQSQFQTYAQNYGALPGDDGKADVRFPGGKVSKGDGNGTLAGDFDTVTLTDESALSWGGLRAAGLVKGEVGSPNQPANSFNGIFGFQRGAFTNGATLAGNVLCLNNVPAAAAMSIDSRLDDGNSNSGSIMSMVGTATVGEVGTGTVAADYGAGQTFTMCMKI